MKKIILSISFLTALFAGVAEAQWVRNPATGTSTGMSFSGGTAITAGVGGWGGYTPHFTAAGCGTYASQYWGGATAGSGSPKDSTNQVAYTMTTVGNGYDNSNQVLNNTPCYPVSPSFSFDTQSGTKLDLSTTTNRHLTISLRSSVAFTAELLMLDGGYQPINTKSPRPSINILGDNTFHIYSINFDTSIVTAAINSVFNVAFLYNSATPLTGRVFANGLAIGSAPDLVAPTTSTNAAMAQVTSSKVYPNPTSDMANIALELKSASDVKVTLTDLMGKEVMTIANGTMSSLNESFSVANLHKGIYSVNYFINGSAAKAEMLMVK